MKHIKEYNEYIYEKFIVEFVNEMATAKDIQRINDLISKSKGNEGKAVQLANQMTNSIKDKTKAMHRYEAALELLGKDHPVTGVFAGAAAALGNNVDGVIAAKEQPKNTRGQLGSDSASLKSMGSNWQRSSYGRGGFGGTPILPLGPTNLVTGKCKYFNIYDTWGKDNDTTVELWQDYEGKYKLIFTSGDGPIFRIGTSAEFQHDQTGRPLFAATLIDWANIGDTNLMVKRYGVKSAPGYVYK